MKKITEMSEEVIKFFKLLDEGYTQKRACDETGLNPKSVHVLFKKYNHYPINKFSKHNIKGDYFDIIDTEAKAYFLGLIIADGSVILEKNTKKDFIKKDSVGYRLAIGLQEEDGYLLGKFSEELGFVKDTKISNNQDGVKFRKPQRRFRFNSKRLVMKLMEKYKILPNKTLDTTFEFPFETIPEHLQRHFIRGFFDGDGSISYYLTKNTFYFNFSFVFTSEVFMNQIKSIFENIFNIEGVIYKDTGKTANWYTLRFKCNMKRKEKMKLIYDWFYIDSTIFMIRKKEKFEKYFKRLNTEVSSEITKGSETP